MIIAFSTSSPEVSVALLGSSGELLAAGALHAPRAASGAALRLMQRLLAESGRRLDESALFVADLGPGSFTGVKVGVTLAKTLAFAGGVRTAGVSSFDLISPHETVVLPSKRGEWFIRRAGEEATRATSLPREPLVGYGVELDPQTFPAASAVAKLLENLQPVDPDLLVPLYLVAPSISTPKQPYGLPRE